MATAISSIVEHMVMLFQVHSDTRMLFPDRQTTLFVTFSCALQVKQISWSLCLLHLGGCLGLCCFLLWSSCRRCFPSRCQIRAGYSRSSDATTPTEKSPCLREEGVSITCHRRFCSKLSRKRLIACKKRYWIKTASAHINWDSSNFWRCVAQHKGTINLKVLPMREKKSDGKKVHLKGWST